MGKNLKLFEEICRGLGCGAYGCGRVSLLPTVERVQQELVGGGRLVRLGAVLRAAGYETDRALLAALEDMAEVADKMSASEKSSEDEENSENEKFSEISEKIKAEILGVRVELPAVIAERREDGYKAFEAKCFIWLVEE